jgi:hypothetical protein
MPGSSAKKAGSPAINRPRRFLVALIAVALAAYGRSGLAQESVASGTLTLNDTSITLAHAYASAEPGFFDKSVDDIRILLSDIPLPGGRTMADLARLGRSGRAHIVEVVLDARGSPLAGAIYSSRFGGMVSLSGMHRFEPRRWEHSRVAGVLRSDGARTFAGVTYQYDASFAATIPRPPTAAQIVERLRTPEAAAVTAYLRAIRSDAIATFLATLTPAAATPYRGSRGAALLAELRADIPANARVTDVPTRTATRSTVTVQGRRDDIVVEYEVQVERVGGAWKVAR